MERSPEELLERLGAYIGIAKIDLLNTKVDAKAAQLLPTGFCEKHLVFPVRISEDSDHVH